MENLCTVLFPLQAIKLACQQAIDCLGTHLFTTSGASKQSTASHLQVVADDITTTEQDEQFFHQLFAENFDAMLLYSRRLTGDLEAAKDIVQDVFKNFWIKRHTIKGAANIKAYLFVSIRNMSYDHCKEVATHMRIERRLPYHLPFDVVAHNASTLEAEMTAAQVITAIKRALDYLPASQKKILVLHFYDGLTISQISSLLDMRFNAVANLKLRAMRNMRKQFTHHSPLPDIFL